jgi:hypothetical protein
VSLSWMAASQQNRSGRTRGVMVALDLCDGSTKSTELPLLAPSVTAWAHTAFPELTKLPWTAAARGVRLLPAPLVPRMRVAGHLDAQRVDRSVRATEQRPHPSEDWSPGVEYCHRAFKLSLGPMFTSILGSSRLNRYILRSARDCTALPPFVECADG